MTYWQPVVAHVVPGYQVASGLNLNPKFPGGTLRMQAPFFLERGFDIGAFHVGTVNISLAPFSFRVEQSARTFRNVKWHPTEPAEDFSFFNVRLVQIDGSYVEGYIYYPHPETKPEHFQKSDVLELLLPFVKGLHYGQALKLEIPNAQMTIELLVPKP